MRFRLNLSYCGTHYHGWQRQPNALTVQETLETAIAKLLRVPVEVIGAGRTDTGVHAHYYVAHFDAEEIPIPLTQFVYMLNGVLPHDIAIQQIFPASPDFHARFDAVSRSYEYWIARTKDPFLTERALQLSGGLSLENMRAASALLLEYSDFASFCKTGTDVHTTLCRLTESQWIVQGHLWIYRITADRFLRNMVRAIVGTLLEVGRGKLSLHTFREIIEAKDRGRAGASVQPQGLYLVNIEYAEFKSQMQPSC